MNAATPLTRPVRHALALAVFITLTGCGGGGTDASTASAVPGNGNTSSEFDTAASSIGTVTAATADTAAGADADATTTAAADAVALAEVVVEPATKLPAAQAESVALDAPVAVAALAAPGPAKDQGAEQATAEVPTMTAQAYAVTTTTVTSRVFYIDSNVGNDGFTGTEASAGANGVGPWRSLAKLAAAALQPGDTIRLACGSKWGETLSLGASGTATLPITVSAYPAGCSNKPRIDGSTTIAATAWTLHSGRIYKATVAAPPLQIHSTAGYPTQAHHPNRGFDSTNPSSMYLRLATNGDKTSVNGRVVSTTLTTGADLVLPAGASLQPGATARVRTNGWTIDESSIASVSGSKLTLAKPTTYPLTAGWGYYLLGQLWMLDSPGEWHHDADTRTLYLWQPDGSSPGASVASTTLATGIDLRWRQHVRVEGLTVSRVGVGVNARRSTSVSLRGNRIDNTVFAGIDGAGSTGMQVLANSLLRIGLEGVNGLDSVDGIAHGMQVTGNSVTDSGVATSGNAIVSLPVHTIGAVVPGAFAKVTENRVIGAGYHGIRTAARSTISRNRVENTCLTLDDCGGIYVYSTSAAGTLIDQNTVRSVPGALEGKPAGSTSQAEGIYLDDHASGVTVQGNTVASAEVGIFLHNAAANRIIGNTLYGNRKHQIWLFEDSNTLTAGGDMYGNEISGNYLFSTAPNAALGQISNLADVSRFASFQGNRYSALMSSRIATEAWPTGSNAFDFNQWQAATTLGGIPRVPDSAGSVLSPVGSASFRVLAGSIVPNGDVTAGNLGWTPWNDKSPLATATAGGCGGAPCLTVVAGASTSLVATPPFSVVEGNWYRVSFDVRSSVPGQPISVLVRRGGGGTNGYESLMGSAEMVNAPGAMQRYGFAFKASKTINAGDPVTRDIGARLYFDRIQPGTSIQLMNVEVVPVSAADASVRTHLLSNPTAFATTGACPDQATVGALCGQFKLFSNDLPVTWPIALPAYSSVIVYSRDTSLIDSDGDGIGDAQDACPATPRGQTVNARGCSLGS